MICKNTCIKKEDVYYHVICLQSNPLLLDSELVFQVQSGLKCTLLSIPPFHPVLPASIFPLSDHISVSTYVQKCMQLVTKMADLTKVLQTKWIIMDFMILKKISQIPQSEISLVELTILTNFCWICHSKISLADLKILMHFYYCMHFWT